MNLGQTMMVIAALGLLGILVLNSNRTVLETTEVQNTSEFGIAAVSLATSLVEEASGKMFDEVIADSTTAVLTDPTQLSSVLGKENAEAYRSGTLDFNDFDDFNGLKLIFKDTVKDTSVVTAPGLVWNVPGLRTPYHVWCVVSYVNPANLNGVSGSRTWHKKLTVYVTTLEDLNPGTKKDTLVYPTIMSFWN
jgi:hypothetical protein